MRKGIIIFVVISLVAGMFGSAFAFDEKITFHGIPWGSNSVIVEEYLKSLFDEETSASYLLSDGVTESHPFTLNGNELGLASGAVMAQVAWCNIHSTIGGYSIDNAVFEFYLPEEAAVGQNNERLMKVGVFIHPDNTDEAEADLINKLNKKYGEGSTFMGAFHYWTGADSTFVMFSNQHTGLSIVYSKSLTPGEEGYFIPEPDEVEPTEVPSNNIDPDDLNGL